MDFESTIKRKWINFRVANAPFQKRVDKNGNRIRNLLSFESFRALFLPYINDERLYMKPGKDSLVICRGSDIGDYEIGNVRIDTNSNNTKEANRTMTERERIKRKAVYKANGHAKAERNSQFGTFWITDGNANSKWHDGKGDIPDGFYRGRKV